MKLDSIITLDLDELSRKRWEKLLGRLTFYDKDGNEVQAYSAQPGKGTIRLPRGARHMLPTNLDVSDLRSCPSMPKVAFTRTLDAKGYGGQADAVKLMAKHEQGLIVIPPGGGKTEIALAFAASCKTRTLVVVHTKDLFDQWVDRAAAACPTMHVGKIRGKEFEVGHLTIAMVQTLKKYLGKGRGFWGKFGCLIVDETHHAAAETFEWVLNTCPAKYRFGFTASKNRADGRSPLVQHLVGPILLEVKFKAKVPLSVQPVRTGFGFKRVVYRGPFDYSRCLRLLAEDEPRNRRIVDMVAEEARSGHSVLVLSRQIKHLEHMAALMPEGIDFDVITSRETQQTRYDMLNDFRNGTTRVLFATALADEGLDVPRLDRIFLTFPSKHDGITIQQIGRAIREHPDKVNALVYDLVDDLVPPLARQYVERKRTYGKLDIKLRKAVGYGTEKKKRRILGGVLKVARPGRG